MKWFWCVTVIAISLGAVWVNQIAITDEKPERGDCIAGAQLFWPENIPNRAQILNQIADIGPVNGSYPTAGLSIRDTHRIYIIFYRDCDKREKMMKETMLGYKEKIKGFPDFQIIKERIEPSSDTIQVYGEYWSDGKEPEGIFEDPGI